MDHVVIHYYSLGNGLYFHERQCNPDRSLLDQVKVRMRELVDQKIEILNAVSARMMPFPCFTGIICMTKKNCSVTAVFPGKFYSLENFEDYFYGFMAPDTSYVQYFDLQLYDEGFVLILPASENTGCSGGF